MAKERIGWIFAAGHVADLARAVAAVRHEVSCAGARLLAEGAADAAARLLDLHHAGIVERDPEASPLADAVQDLRGRRASERARRSYDASLDVVLKFSAVGDRILIVPACVPVPLLRTLDGREDLVAASWSLGPPARGISEREWRARGDIWVAYDALPRLGRDLVLDLFGDRLPNPTVKSVVRRLPSLAERAERTALAKLCSQRFNRPEPPGAQGAVLAEWLRSGEGRAAFLEAKRDLAALLQDRPGEASLAKYGERRRARAPRQTGPVPIDHADIMQTHDGRTFMAVMDAGLAPNARVFVQIGDNFVTVVQNSLVKGQIDRIPKFAMDILRGFTDIILVELVWEGDRRVPKAQHRAIVSDIGERGMFDASVSRWSKSQRSTRTARTRAKGGAEQWVTS
ncbi:hypothetical protein BHAOGJBA_1226 [Methylobacterium hispanicum]|uniref:Uncharacterized protein n=1 Tax=Methylobacterium hispanicum TaxID=270350 RepID=A0AAV4ZHX6_9HYPH|nr:hypothetical protein [Methylobacterium hispanicum]GJD87721.1 hypothetical protein BHAOGJBA_1226 [Methylobacterium hispanicum]